MCILHDKKVKTFYKNIEGIMAYYQKSTEFHKQSIFLFLFLKVYDQTIAIRFGRIAFVDQLHVWICKHNLLGSFTILNWKREEDKLRFLMLYLNLLL